MTKLVGYQNCRPVPSVIPLKVRKGMISKCSKCTCKMLVQIRRFLVKVGRPTSGPWPAVVFSSWPRYLWWLCTLYIIIHRNRDTCNNLVSKSIYVTAEFIFYQMIYFYSSGAPKRYWITAVCTLFVSYLKHVSFDILFSTFLICVYSFYRCTV